MKVDVSVSLFTDATAQVHICSSYRFAFLNQNGRLPRSFRVRLLKTFLWVYSRHVYQISNCSVKLDFGAAFPPWLLVYSGGVFGPVIKIFLLYSTYNGVMETQILCNLALPIWVVYTEGLKSGSNLTKYRGHVAHDGYACQIS